MTGTYLLVELDEGGFKLLVDVAADVVHILGLGERLAGISLFRTEVLYGGTGHGVEGNLDVVSVSVFIKLDVTHFLVRDNGGVVRGNVARQFREVRSHLLRDVEESVEVVFNCIK